MESLSSIIDKIDKENIILPSFQRVFVWEPNAQKDLIASVLTNIPCTSSLIVKKDSTTKLRCKKIGHNEKQISQIPTDKNEIYLLDGQQRYTSLYYALTDQYYFDDFNKSKEVFNSVFDKIRYRWFLNFDILINGQISDKFGFKNLEINKDEWNNYLPEDIETLIVFKKLTLTGKEFYNLNSDFSVFIKGCIDKNIIPLNLVFSTSAYKISSILKEIQKSRLKIFINNNQLDQLQLLVPRHISFKDFSSKKADFQIKKKKKDVEKYFEDKIEMASEEWAEGFSRWLFDRFGNYNIEPILLDNINKAAVTYSFINTAGTDLSTLDLICAKSIDDNLREKIVDEIQKEFKFLNNKFKLEPVQLDVEDFEVYTDTKGLIKSYSDLIIQIFNIIHFKNSGRPIDEFSPDIIKQKYSLENINNDVIVKNFDTAMDVIRKISYLMKFHCGQVTFKKVTNKLVLIPIAAGLIYTDKSKHDVIIKKLIAFFWIKLLKGEYESHQNEKASNHTKDVVNWICNDDSKVEATLLQELEKEVLENEFSNSKITCSGIKGHGSLRHNILTCMFSINSDFPDFDGFNTVIQPGNKDINVHHLIPLDSVSTIGNSTKKIRNKEHPLNAIMNLTIITKSSNAKINRFELDDYCDLLSATTKDKHCLKKNWEKFTYKEKDQSVVNEYKKMLLLRHEDIAKEIRNKLIDYIKN